MSATEEKASCRLVVEVLQVVNDQLTLRYTFSNGGATNVYLFHRLYDRIDEKKVFQTDVNNVYVEARGARLIISKKIFAVPRDIDVERPNVPCASLVKPGGNVTETLQLALPVVPKNPYNTLSPLDLIAQEVDLWFEVGFVALPPEGEKLAVNVDTLGGPAFYFGSFQPSKQALLSTGPLPKKVPARLP